jgi:hypothetical protein
MIYCQYLIKVGRKKEEDRKVLYKLLLTQAKKYYLWHFGITQIFRHFFFLK